MTIPYPIITAIPDTEPDAVPALWNGRYTQIDANFGAVEAEIAALQADVTDNISGTDTAAILKATWKYSGRIMYVEKWKPSWTLLDPIRVTVLTANFDSNIVDVINTAGLFAGQFYRIIAVSGVNELIRISTIDSATRLTLVGNLENTYPSGSVILKTTFVIYPDQGIAVATNNCTHYFGPLDAGNSDSIKKITIRRSANDAVMEVWFYNDTINTEWTMIPTHDVVRYVPGEPYCEVDYNITTRGNTHFGLRCLDSTGVQPVHVTAIYFYEPTTASDSGMSEMIVTNTRFYVTLTGNDTTGNGSLLAPWRTLKHAMTALQSCWISSAATVTIELGDGYHNHTELVDIGHPCGSRIVITGKNCYSTTAVAFNGIALSELEGTGPFTSYYPVFTLSSVDNITTDDWLCLTTINPAVPQTPQMSSYMGCHKVVEVNSDTKQVKLWIRRKTAIETLPDPQVCSMNVKVIKTVMYFNTEIGILIDKGNTIGAIRNIAIFGNNTVPTTIGAGALSVWNGSNVRIGGAFGVHGFQIDGISCRNLSNIILEDGAFVAINGCRVGVHLTGNCFFGINYGTFVAIGVWIGIDCCEGASFHANRNSKIFLIGNKDYGVAATACGFVLLGVTMQAVIDGPIFGPMVEGNPCDIIAHSGGYVRFQNNSGVYSTITTTPDHVGIYTPTPGVVEYGLGYISFPP